MDKLEEIFQRIHDNVYSHSLLSDQRNPLSDQRDQIGPVMLPPLPPHLLERIAAIRNTQAPYYIVSGNPLTRLIKRVHNLVLKLFGRKQAFYNHLTLDLLESMAAYLQDLQEHNKTQSSRIEALVSQVMLQTEQLADYQKLLSTVEQIAPKQNEGQQADVQTKQPASQQNEKL